MSYHARSYLTRFSPWLLVAIGLAYALRSGLRSDSPVRSLDSQWLYVAGSTFVSGGSPYDLAAFQQTWRDRMPGPPVDCPFAYSPTILWLVAPLSVLPWSSARVAFDAINGIALALMGGVAVTLTRAFLTSGRDHSIPTLSRAVTFSAAGCFVSGIPAVLLLGQTTFFGLAGALGTWLGVIHRRSSLIAISLALCSFKPQVALLPIAWLVCSGHARLILTNAWFTLLLGLGALTLMPWKHLAVDMITSVHGYQAFVSNRPPYVTGVATLFDAWPILFSSTAFWTLVALLIVFASARWNLRHDNVLLGASELALTLAMTGVFVQLHTYDHALYLPVVVLASTIRSRPSLLVWLIALAAIGRAPNLHSFIQSLGAPGEWNAARVCTLAAIPVFLLAVMRIAQLHQLPQK